MKLILTSIIFFYFSSIYALEVACTHEEVCSLVSKSFKEKLITRPLVVINGDPHEFEPTPSQIKNLLNAPILVSGPIELNPWIAKVLNEREKNKKLITVSLQLKKEQQTTYQTHNTEALSHFWLYPQVYCDFKNQLLHHSAFQNLTKMKDCNVENIEFSLREHLKNIQLPFILSHDALEPLLKFYGPKSLNIISLKSSTHHDEVSPASIKKMYSSLNNGKVIWLIETGIDIPHNISSKIRSTDTMLKIDTSKNINDVEFSTLNELLKQLKK